jgi:acyl-CoA reductase-like NAD-dependent aldehyde dehydrogenase
LTTQTITVRNPATLKRIAECPVANPADVAAAVARAREAQAIWQTTRLKERSRLLYRLRDLLLDEQEKLADVLTSETGKPRAEVYGNELFYLCDAIGVWAKKGADYLRPERIRPHFLLVKAKKVVTIIRRAASSASSARGIFPDVDPGRSTSRAHGGQRRHRKTFRADAAHGALRRGTRGPGRFSEHLLQVVVGAAATGEALIDQADMIAFTGSVETGKHVMRRAAERLIPVSLELGGKDPMIVLRDADLERAAGACVWGALMNAGQVCTSIERVYVEAPVYQQFVDKIEEKVRAIRQGPSDDEVDVGSMTSEAQLQKVEAQVAEAVAQGAKALVGGRRNPRYKGNYFEPTVLIDVEPSMSVMKEETFGPIIPI